VRTAIYPGTFDPVTLGHVDLVERGFRMFDRIVVAVADSRTKSPMFTLEERVAMFQDAVSSLGDVSVVPFDKLTVHFAQDHDACAIIRGLRAVSDFDYEFQLAWMNRKLVEEVETVFPTGRQGPAPATLDLTTHADVSIRVPALRRRSRDLSLDLGWFGKRVSRLRGEAHPASRWRGRRDPEGERLPQHRLPL
jgi:pantetheine-phosphate adenylyltransferase